MNPTFRHGGRLQGKVEHTLNVTLLVPTLPISPKERGLYYSSGVCACVCVCVCNFTDLKILVHGLIL